MDLKKKKNMALLGQDQDFSGNLVLLKFSKPPSVYFWSVPWNINMGQRLFLDIIPESPDGFCALPFPWT